MRCAIFCNIIDNYGDIGICWRLARQLAEEYPLDVSLFVDDLNSFAVLAPQIQPDLPVQPLGQITVYHWHSALCFEQPYELVIEGFGCRLSDQLIAQMHQQTRAGQPPIWVNLEYMSAEDWVMECHGLMSIHPATGLEQTFWFPSPGAHGGGLIREQFLIDCRNQFQQDFQQQTAFWHSLSLPDAMQFSRKISLFSYENQHIASLLDALAEDNRSSLLLVPKSKSLPDIEQWLQARGILAPAAEPLLQVGDRIHYRNLVIVILPFLSHVQYDQLLWACDLNFIRGEDSCVRAQWAARPFIWHIYPQDDNAHLVKLQAWIDQVNKQVCPAQSWQTTMHCWNTATTVEPANDSHTWQQLLGDLPHWHNQLADWSHALAQQPDLATRLMNWVQQRHPV